MNASERRNVFGVGNAPALVESLMATWETYVKRRGSDTQHPVIAFDDRRVQALAANNLDTFAALLDDELVYVYSIGLVHSKPELLGMFRHALRVRDLRRTVRRVIANSDFALVTMKQRMRFHLRRQPAAGARGQDLRQCDVATTRAAMAVAAVPGDRAGSDVSGRSFRRPAKLATSLPASTGRSGCGSVLGAVRRGGRKPRWRARGLRGRRQRLGLQQAGDHLAVDLDQPFRGRVWACQAPHGRAVHDGRQHLHAGGRFVWIEGREILVDVGEDALPDRDIGALVFGKKNARSFTDQYTEPAQRLTYKIDHPAQLMQPNNHGPPHDQRAEQRRPKILADRDSAAIRSASESGNGLEATIDGAGC